MTGQGPDEIFRDIIEKMKNYHPSHDFSVIQRAYDLAKKAHEGQNRASGEPYVMHPLEVAKILTSIEMDRDTIAAAILHDVIEDSKLEYEDLERTFNADIAGLVDGVTKLDKVNYSGDYNPVQTETDTQADTYRKMFLATSNDPRVIIIKIADRLHNMRTIKHMPPSHKKRKAEETMAIYAPLAHRLGISKLRYELEDLAFRFHDPAAYQELKEQISKKQDERAEYIRDLVRAIEEKLKEEGIECRVIGRPKHFFSIYKKMMQQGKTLDEIYDLHAVRVITDDMISCYHALGVLSGMYTPVPGRFKDYIGMPKANKYQSIHNTLIGPGGEPFEIQIRTYDMDRVSEYGVAAHWKYKSDGKDSAADAEKLTWLGEMMDWQRDLSENSDFVAALTYDLNPFRGHIYCFTPKGRVVELLNDSTPIDFAYTIHSAVGNSMTGAKVNNKIVPLETKLATGDRVEILTNKNSKGPSKDWLEKCRTSNARTKINSWFKKLNKEENIVKGREMLEAEAKKRDLTLQQLAEPKLIAAVLHRYSYTDWNTLCASVGHGSISEGQVINRLHGEYLRLHENAWDKDKQIIQLVNEGQRKGGSVSESGLAIKGDKSLSVRLAHCCSPMPGDEIVGYITRGRGLSIHRSDCINMVNLDELSRRQVTPIEWEAFGDSENSHSFYASLDILTANRHGVVTDISRVISDEKINMDSINSYKQKDDVLIRVAFMISGKEILDKLIRKLSEIRGIYSVKRTIT